MLSKPRFNVSLLAVLSLAMAALFCAVPSVRAAYSLESAARAGLLTVSGFASSSYSEATLTILNKASTALDIDFSTVCFVQNNDTQRVGLAYEKSTGSYVLRFAAGKQYTLRFSSRCLDQNRHSPVTGTAFAKFFQIDTTAFAPIVNALRNNYSQSSVWSITDGNTALSQAWKRADSRPAPGGTTNPPVTSSGIRLSGNCSWSTSGNQVKISVAKVENRNTSGVSGTLRLSLWASKTPYSGSSISGYMLGTTSLGTLRAGYAFNNIANYTTFSRPPSGYYYTTIILEEYNGSYYMKDYITFSNPTSF